MSLCEVNVVLPVGSYKSVKGVEFLVGGSFLGVWEHFVETGGFLIGNLKNSLHGFIPFNGFINLENDVFLMDVVKCVPGNGTVCGARIDAFLASVVASLPFVSRMHITTGLAWWISLPPARIFKAFQESLGVNFIAWIISPCLDDQVAFAREMVSVKNICAAVRDFLIDKISMEVTVQRVWRS